MKLQTLFSGNKLTTGDQHDPLLPKLITAINHACEIEITVSFIQPSGINLLFDALAEALQRKVSLKILVSDYLYITNPVALRRLKTLQDRGAQTKLFNCIKNTSFHMKSYIFTKNSHGAIVEGCAFVGSNNISKAALTHAHEWCLRHDFEQPINSSAAKEFLYIRQQFALIFAHRQSQILTNELINRYSKKYSEANQKQHFILVDDNYNNEILEPATPNSMQELALTALNNTRTAGFKRGLVVLATGMGKTWLSAFDVMQTKAKKVLFVAHREEILLQAEQTFIKLFKEAQTGFYNGNNKNTSGQYIFASIQTLGQQQHLTQFAPNHFDYIVIDEFHHATSKSYKNLLNYFQPEFMLGLTATPDRSDQADLLSLCDNNLVFERNLVHGIDANILVPFNYHGIYDEFVNYEEIPWRNGKFEANALNTALATKQRTAHIYQHWQDKKQSRTLAFCISTKHADYMATAFSQKGIKACAVYNGSIVRRNEALTQLAQGEISIIFSVDLFNEGTDLPAIDTILMLRPTNSAVLFLQQLGRGLRQSPSTAKSKLTVIDFIGNHKSFLNKPASLLGTTNPKIIIEKTEQGHIELANGCFINYAPELIRFWQTLATKYRHSAIEDYQLLKNKLGYQPSATEFFQQGYDLTKMRKQCHSWFLLVYSQEKDQNAELKNILNIHADFLLLGIETTKMSKCFKGILLEAFLTLDGFNTSPTTAQLAEQSWHILARQPELKKQELPTKQQTLSANSKAWRSYWLSNPIKAFTCLSKSQNKLWFIVENGRFKANFQVKKQHIATLHLLMQELVDLRLAEYKTRIEKRQAASKIFKDKTKVSSHTHLSNNVQPISGTRLPYYADLKIACGHFKSSEHEQIENHLVLDGFGKLDPAIHFVANASGNSMNGGKNPILDGDLLLLERITATNSGSISNLTMAIELLDETGDEQYLLRVVKKQSDGSYLLHANNPDYEDKPSTEQMKTFARLKAILPQAQ